MSEFRLRFVKEGRAAWISHLDLLRTFQRVFIRSGMVIRHSQGFHPHPIMSFVLPLSVGQTSVCELLDFSTVEDLPCEGMAERLNRYLPEGVRVLNCAAPVHPVRDMRYLEAEVTLEYESTTTASLPEPPRPSVPSSWGTRWWWSGATRNSRWWIRTSAL